MEEKKRSKKPYIFGGLFILVIAIIGLTIYVQQDTKQKEEIWAFSDTLDQTYFPLRDEFEACVYPEKTDKDETNNYDCIKLDILETNQEVRERINNYEVTSDDAKKLKNEVLNGIDLIDKISKELEASDEFENKEDITAEDASKIAENIGDLTRSEKDFDKNYKKIIGILVPEYYSKYQ
jgi:hypothetical protein